MNKKQTNESTFFGISKSLSNLKRIALVAGLPIAAATLLVACDDDSGTNPPAEGGATVEGRVEQTSDPAAVSGPAATSVAAEEAETVVIGSMQSNGSVSSVAEAQVEADGSFTIRNVPSGRSDLVVVARSSGNTDVGRVTVHGTTVEDATIRVAPINARTTARGRVQARLHAQGNTSEAQTGSEMELWMHYRSDAAAQAVASSQTQVNAMADAYAEAQATMTQVMAEFDSDVDAQARAEAWVDAAASYHQELDAGASASTAWSTYSGTALGALIDAGASAEAAAVGAAGTASTMANIMAQGSVDSSARAHVAGAISSFNLRARELLAASVSSSSLLEAQADQMASAMAEARGQVQAASSTSEIQASLDGTLTSAQSVVIQAVLSLASDLSLTALAELETTLESAFASADLSARFEGTTSASAAATAAANYRTEVEAAAQAVVNAMETSSNTVDVETMTRLLIAAGASGSVS